MDEATLRARIAAVLHETEYVDGWGRRRTDADRGAAALAALFAPILAERDALIRANIFDCAANGPGTGFDAFPDSGIYEHFDDMASAVAYVREHCGLPATDPLASLAYGSTDSASQNPSEAASSPPSSPSPPSR
jgi:hypothetical protein